MKFRTHLHSFWGESQSRIKKHCTHTPTPFRRNRDSFVATVPLAISSSNRDICMRMVQYMPSYARLSCSFAYAPKASTPQYCVEAWAGSRRKSTAPEPVADICCRKNGLDIHGRRTSSGSIVWRNVASLMFNRI